MVRILTITLSLLGVHPEAVIQGDAEVAPGDLVVLSAADSHADPGGLAWILGNSDRRYLEVDGGKSLIFASGTPGQYRFFLIAASVDDGKILLDRATHVVTVKGPIPPPVPVPVPPTPIPPGPAPAPPSPAPDGPLGLTRASRDGLLRVTAADRSAQAVALARAQRAHAAAVAAGAFPNPSAILAGWREANKTAVAADVWAGWGEAVSAALKVLYAAGKLPANGDWAAAFREIADGLGG